MSMSAAERAAAEIYAKAMDALTPEQARHVWLAISSLVMASRDAEQAAYLVMAGTDSARDVAEFNRIMRDHLKNVHEQLKFVSGILHGATT